MTLPTDPNLGRHVLWEPIPCDEKVRKAVLEERNRCANVISKAMSRYLGTSASLVLVAVLHEILEEPK